MIAAGPRTLVFQPGGYDYPNTPTIGPEASLPAILTWSTRRVAAYAKGGSIEPSPNPDTLYRRTVSATMPEPSAQLDAARSMQLTRAEKQTLDMLAAWPFCTPDQLAGLLGSVTRRRANQVLSALRRRSLVQREPDGYVLTDDGLTSLARRDRSAAGPMLDRWTPQHSDDGAYFGSALRALASQADHQQGITEFAARLAAEVTRHPDYELLNLLPTHRSQITYWHSGSRCVLHPDASFQLGDQGDWDWCLLEYERRAVTPKRVTERLHGYRRYFMSDYVKRDHGGSEPVVLFLFETAEAEETFLAARLRHAPYVSSNLPTLAEGGGCWARPGACPPPHPTDRAHLHAVGTVSGHVPECHCAQPERFLWGPPHPLVHFCPAQNSRSALGMPPPGGQKCPVVVSRSSPARPFERKRGEVVAKRRRCEVRR